MRHDLVPEEIEIHPLIAAAALGAAEQAAVELARGAQRVDGNGEMKGLQHGTIYLRFHHSSRARTARSGWSEKKPVIPASSSASISLRRSPWAVASPADLRSGGRNSFSARSVQTERQALRRAHGARGQCPVPRHWRIAQPSICAVRWRKWRFPSDPGRSSGRDNRAGRRP